MLYLHALADIDECEDPRMNNCVWRCINKEGDFDCICPPGSSGDGRKQGSGCRKVALLEIGLGKLFPAAIKLIS